MKDVLPRIFKEGMIVRVPVDTDEYESLNGDYRDFRSGSICQVDTPDAQVTFWHRQLDREYAETVHINLDDIHRAYLPNNIPFVQRSTNRQGIILCLRQVKHHYASYFVQFGDEIETVCETDIQIISQYQAPHPVDQLRRYELHHPIWQSRRNALLEQYRELQNTTFGIEDLIGTRVQLLAHQAEVIVEVLSQSICRNVLADEVGLGKTIEACVIIKSLKRREDVRTLIIAPQTLVRQWRTELDQKFWLNFWHITADSLDSLPDDNQDVIMSTESLDADSHLQLWVQMQTWDLMVVDEAHRIHSQEALYDTLVTLSELSRHVLLMSATPVQRRANEYIALLKLLDPVQYDSLDETTLRHMLQAQQTLREVIAHVVPDLTPEYFDPDEFRIEMGIVLDELSHDTALEQRVRTIQTADDLDKAKDIVAYVSTNYRLEERILRNRRKTLREREQVTLPQRTFTLHYTYRPSTSETQVLEALHNYAALLDADNADNALLFYLFQAVASSPHSLQMLLQHRLRGNALPMCRADSASLRRAFAQPKQPGEDAAINDLLLETERWLSETTDYMQEIPQRQIPVDSPHRLAQVLRAIDEQLQQPTDKILIFSAWHPTLGVLYDYLKRRYGTHRVARFQTNLSADELQSEVDRFQADPDCRLLLTDESGGEGRNFQIANSIIHVDLPWTPARIEQRIGRVDRLGRSGEVLSIVPCALGTVEADFVSIWQDAFNLFSQSMSGMEIVLESIQDQLQAAFNQNSRDGIANLQEAMMREAAELRRTVEEERYYEEQTDNLSWSTELRYLLQRYNDQDILREPLLAWAELAGLRHHYDPETEFASIGKRDFNMKSIRNAKFINVPNMQEALVRSRRANTMSLTGTFNRHIAIQREDIIFFAPGEPWTDTILKNAILSDRGRCCAIQRTVPELSHDWYGIEYFFSCRVDPRSLYERGLLPTHLFRASEFFSLPATQQILMSFDAEVMPYNSIPRQATRESFNRRTDTHLGKRGGSNPPLPYLKQFFTPVEWEQALETTSKAALAHLHQRHGSISDEDAQQARHTLEQRIRGQQAALEWLPEENRQQRQEHIERMKIIAAAITEGIATPEWTLESACFWMLANT